MLFPLVLPKKYKSTQCFLFWKMRKIVCHEVLAFVIASAVIITGISSQLMINPSPVLASLKPKQNVILAVILNDFNNHQGKLLLDSAIDKLRSNHPNLN